MEAVAALRRQTYENMEIILINNGATAETVAYLHQVEAADKRVKLVNFEFNVYSPNDPAKYVDICFNAALEIATGDYIWCQSDDDYIADDYAEKMVALFRENPECTTAAGLPVSIVIDGKLNSAIPTIINQRPRYMPGHLLVMDIIRGGRTLFNAPGAIFTVQREFLVKAGGFRQPIELLHLYGMVPFGVTGFDETAISYWRHHEGQLNKEATARGIIGSTEVYSLLKDLQIERRWQVFGRKIASELIKAINLDQCARAGSWMTTYLYSRNFDAALRLTRAMWSRPQFWYKTLGKSAERALHIKPARALLRPLLRRIFWIAPAIPRFFPGLARIQNRIDP